MDASKEGSELPNIPGNTGYFQTAMVKPADFPGTPGQPFYSMKELKSPRAWENIYTNHSQDTLLWRTQLFKY